ncbi:MAG: hypothetical protein K5897_06745 [Eubacterium sp.]|nr:hypothetical protein [Eubacterium sp.]
MAKPTKKKTKNEYRKSMILCFVLAGIFLAVAGIWIAIHWNYMILGKTTQLNTEIMMGNAPQKGDYATLNVKLVLGNYAETKHRINGIIPIGTDQHYAIVLFDEDALYVISATVKNKSDIDRLEKMVDASWALLTGESEQWPDDTVELTGKITTMDSQILGFYKQQLSQAGVTTEYFKQIYELTLDATESRLSKFLYLGFFLLLAFFCILGAFGSRKQMKNVEDIQAIARENAADPSLNPFLNGASATANPYAASMNAPDSTNPYAAGSQAETPNPYTAGTNPYGAAGTEAPANPYANTGAAPYGTDTQVQDPQAQGASFPGASSSEDDTTVLVAPDSATSDSYNSDSYTRS